MSVHTSPHMPGRPRSGRGGPRLMSVYPCLCACLRTSLHSRRRLPAGIIRVGGEVNAPAAGHGHLTSAGPCQHCLPARANTAREADQSGRGVALSPSASLHARGRRRRGVNILVKRHLRPGEIDWCCWRGFALSRGRLARSLPGRAPEQTRGRRDRGRVENLRTLRTR